MKIRKRNSLMQKFDVLILKRNINDLMRNKGIKQQQLAAVIGMSQSNISKALSEKDKKCFTVEQIVSIADYFGVSIDWLLGFKTAQKMETSPRGIAAFVAKLLESGIARSTRGTIPEVVFESYLNSHGFQDSRQENRKIEYPMLYFPNYWYPQDITDDEFEQDELMLEAQQTGNETKNVALNSFLDKYLAILDLYKKKQLSEEPYQIVLKDYLSQLEET